MGANLPRIGALTLLLSYLAIVIAAYDATLRPGPLSLRVGHCTDRPCVTWVMPNGRAWQAGARPGMQVLSLDGRSLSNLDPRLFPMDGIAEAELLTSAGEDLLVELQEEAIAKGLTKFSLWLLGGIFAVLGATVFLRRPTLTSSRWFAAFAGSSAAAIAVGPASGGPHPEWSLVVQVVAIVGIGSTCLPFVAALVVDEERFRFRISIVFLVLGLAILSGYAVSVAEAPVLYGIVRPAFVVLLTVSVLGAVGLLVVTARRQRSPVRRLQGRIALWGIALGTLPFIILAMITAALGVHSLVPDHLSVLTAGFIPAAFAYAILQHNLLGIRRLVHRGMVYGIASATTLALILLSLTVAASAVGRTPGEDGSILLEALLLTAGVALFFPVRRAARWLVDRTFYGDVSRYEEFVDLVRRDQLTPVPTREIITGIVGRLVNALHLESAALFLGAGPSDASLLTAAGPRAGEVVAQIYPGISRQIPDAGDRDLLDVTWESDSLLVVVLRSPGRRIGFAILGPKLRGEVFVEDEKRLALTVAPLLALAVDQSNLSSELRELNQRLVGAQELERKRLAFDIHDGALQKAIVLTRVNETAIEDQGKVAGELVSELREVCSRLRPAILDDLGIVSALDWLLEGESDRTGVPIGLSLQGVDEDERLQPDSELTLFRVTQEAINNSLKHAKATRIDVSLAREADSLLLMVEDDGVGFSPGSFHNGRAGEGGIGLSGIRERIIHLKGSLDISSAPGAGTTILARIPRSLPSDRVEART